MRVDVDMNVAELQATFEISQQQEDGCCDESKCTQEGASGKTQGSCVEKESNDETWCCEKGKGDM